MAQFVLLNDPCEPVNCYCCKALVFDTLAHAHVCRDNMSVLPASPHMCVCANWRRV